MASTVAAAAAHSMPPFPITAMPRVRPPPIPKGTPGPASLPAPGPPPQPHLVWADGEWRKPESRSARQKTEKVSRQLEKALRHQTHGMNIYAYRNVATNQVVYSLSNHMDNNKILKQLLFHGKKTVPSALRRDVWRPYFSLHLPKTPAGAAKGLKIYQELRELSLRRQLDPPKEMIYATQRHLDTVLNKVTNPLNLEHDTNYQGDERGADYKRKELPVPGRKLPQETIAKRLMRQTASSVADLAAVLTRMSAAEEGKTLLTPQQQLLRRQQAAKDYLSVLSARASQRLAKIREAEEKKSLEIDARKDYLHGSLANVPLDKHTVARISSEYEIGDDNGDGVLDAVDASTLTAHGARLKLAEARAVWEADKALAIDELVTTEMAKVESQLDQLPEDERARVMAEFDAAQKSAQQEWALKISNTQEEFRKARDEFKANWKGRQTVKYTKYLNTMKNTQNEEILKMKVAAKLECDWVGPYANIAQAVKKLEEQFAWQWSVIKAPLQPLLREESAKETDKSTHEVEVRWADIRDGTWAKEWPESVFHVELESKAVSYLQKGQSGPEYTTSSVHTFGSDIPEQTELDQTIPGRYKSPQYLAKKHQEGRTEKALKFAESETARSRARLDSLRSELEDLEDIFSGYGERLAKVAPTLHECVEQVERARNIIAPWSTEIPKEQDLSLVAQINEWILHQLPLVKEEVQQLPPSVDEDLTTSQNAAAEARIQWINLRVEELEIARRDVAALREPEADEEGQVEESAPQQTGVWSRLRGMFSRS